MMNLIVSLIAGVLGGNTAAAVLKPLNLGMYGNSLAGLAGGFVAGQLALRVDAVASLSQLGNTGAAGVIAVLIASALGGFILTMIGGLLRQVMARH